MSKPLKIAVSSVATESAGYRVEQVVKRVTSTAIQTLFRPGSRAGQGEGGSRSKEQAPFVQVRPAAFPHSRRPKDITLPGCR